MNKDNFKALFRKGKALGEQGWFEKAETILVDLLKKNPNGKRIAQYATLLNLNAFSNRCTLGSGRIRSATCEGQGAGEEV